MFIRNATIAALAAMTISGAASAANRDYISIVGSSTVYPFSTVVAEKFGKTTKFKTPKIESTGTGGGMKLFCEGLGVDSPDITNASRRMKDSEFQTCKKNGVTDVVEVLIGYDGIVIANSKAATQINLTQRDLFLALAKEIPDPNGAEKTIANPYMTWKDVNANLPATKIEVLGPPPTSGTRDAFSELVMEVGCQSFPWVKALEKSDKNAYKTICHSIREDGLYIETGENDNLIVQKLEANANAFGIFGFSFLEQNSDKVQGSLVNGHPAKFESIASGDYPVSRPLYFYVKKAHIGKVPGIEEFIKEFTSEKAWGSEGYLSEKGMIPLAEGERKKIGSEVGKLKTLQAL